MGGTIPFLALFVQNYIFGQEDILSRSCAPVSCSIFPPKYKQQMKVYYTVENLCLEMDVLETMAQCVRDTNLL